LIQSGGRHVGSVELKAELLSTLSFIRCLQGV
jgi:hypothetical protein